MIASSNSGKLGYEEFQKCALELVQKSKLLFDDWQIKRDESRGEIYLVKTSTSGLLKFEHHVIYSVAYSVPVLYFRMFRPDTGEIVWHSDELLIAKQENGGLSQMPHPYEQTPFLQLHPCHTANWMAEMRSMAAQSTNYLVSWLSFIGPQVGLDVSEKYTTTCPS